MTKEEERIRKAFPLGTRVFHMRYGAELRAKGFLGIWPVTGYEWDSKDRLRVVVGHDTRYLPEDLAIVPVLGEVR